MGDTQGAKPPVHRLHDMLVEEVSLVDRAANRRKFLLVKRDAMGAGAQITAKPDGTYTAAGGGGSAPAPNTNAPAPAPGASSTTKASVTLTEEAKGALMEMSQTCIDLCTEALDLCKNAKVVEPGEPMDAQACLDLFAECIGEMEDTIAATFGVDDEMEGEGVPPPAEGAAAPVTANAPPLSKRLELARAQRVLAKAQLEKLGRGLVAKYGARMKKERLLRFQNALNALVAIANEVMPPAPVDKTRPAAPVAAPPKGAATAPTDVAKGAPVADVSKHPTVVELQKQLKAATEKLAALEKSVQPSNAAAVDAGSAGKPAGDDFTWPLDMNAAAFGDRNDPNFFGR